MLIEMLQGKIHRATVKQAELHYVGSITCDPVLCEAAGIAEYQKVCVADVDNGNRFETYVIFGDTGSGMICMNGAAAHGVCGHGTRRGSTCRECPARGVRGR